MADRVWIVGAGYTSLMTDEVFWAMIMWDVERIGAGMVGTLMAHPSVVGVGGALVTFTPGA